MYFRKVSTKSGDRWVCVAEGPRDPVSGKRQQIARRAKGKKEAQRKVEKVLHDIEDNKLINRKKAETMPFDKLAYEWLQVYSTGVKKSTVRVRAKEIKILCRYIAKARINHISRKMYQDILVDLAKQDYARTTIEGVHVTANMIFKQAITWQMLKDNPCTDAKIPKKRLTIEDIEKSKIENKYFEKEEIKEFLHAVDKHGLFSDKAIFYLLIFSGMRCGELCALKWDDIDFNKNSISITKTLYCPDNNKNKYELTPPKTADSVRKIDMDKSIMSILKTHKAKQSEIIMRDHDDYHDEGFVIAHIDGYPYMQKNVEMRMRRLLEKTSIQKDLTPHGLRHTYVSILTEAEIDLKTIMKRVGHKDMKTTIEIYTHVTEKMKKDASQKVNDYLKSILTDSAF